MKIPTLYVRDFPDDLHRKVKRLAARRHRSLGAEVIVLLDEALKNEELMDRRIQALNRIEERRRSYVPTGKEVDSLILLREDRDR